MKSLPLSVYLKGLLSCFYLLILSFVTVVTVRAQAETDLQVTIDSQPETARGGERIKYVYSIKNNGPSSTEAFLLGSNETMLEYVSATPIKGSCEINERDQYVLRCRIGDLSPGESATVEITALIRDIDDLRALGAGNGNGSGTTNKSSIEEEPYPLSWVNVYSSIKDVNEQNDHVQLEVKLRPSANKPPIVKIISPKENEILVRPATSKISHTISIEASDPDGKIVAVKIEGLMEVGFIGPDEKGNLSFEYEGVRYSAVELQAYLANHPPPEKVATPTGKNIYTYTMKSVPYGRNILTVVAVDNGGRESRTATTFDVKSDSTIEIVSPKKNEIVEPGSSITIETISTLKQGRLLDVTVSGDGVSLNGEPIKMELVSKQGNVYRHRFQIDNVKSNNFRNFLDFKLNEVDGGYADAHVGFLVRDVPKMAFTSFRDGDVVEPEAEDQSRKIRIVIQIENRRYNDQYELYIDGKYHNDFSSDALFWINPPVGKHTLQIVATFGPITDKVEIARSPLINVTVK